jgi:uncharacterized protein
MSTPRLPSDVAFSPAVKAVQLRKGSRKGYEQMERKGGWEVAIDATLAGFIAEQRSVFLATASRDGQPHVQHRGGPRGFLRVLDEHTIAFADYTGNRQYISEGNLSENPKAQLFLIDYANRRRVKIWGEAQVSTDPQLLRRLMPEGYAARPEQAIVMRVTAWDANCPQHIPVRIDADDVQPLLAERDERIARMEREIDELHARLAGLQRSP